METEDIREKIDGFLTDLESDIKQYGLTEPIRGSARAVFLQIVKEAGYKSPEECRACAIEHITEHV